MKKDTDQIEESTAYMLIGGLFATVIIYVLSLLR